MSRTPTQEERYKRFEGRISLWCFLTYFALMIAIGFVGRSVIQRLMKIEVELRKIEIKLERLEEKK